MNNRNQGVARSSVHVFKSYTLEQYKDVACFQLEVPALARALHEFTGGKMCEGCPKFEDAKGCASLRELQRRDLAGRIYSEQSKPPVETVKQEAARRGISISEVRRQRNKIGGAS